MRLGRFFDWTLVRRSNRGKAEMEGTSEANTEGAQSYILTGTLLISRDGKIRVWK